MKVHDFGQKQPWEPRPVRWSKHWFRLFISSLKLKWFNIANRTGEATDRLWVQSNDSDLTYERKQWNFTNSVLIHHLIKFSLEFFIM